MRESKECVFSKVELRPTSSRVVSSPPSIGWLFTLMKPLRAEEKMASPSPLSLGAKVGLIAARATNRALADSDAWVATAG